MSLTDWVLKMQQMQQKQQRLLQAPQQLQKKSQQPRQNQSQQLNNFELYSPRPLHEGYEGLTNEGIDEN